MRRAFLFYLAALILAVPGCSSSRNKDDRDEDRTDGGTGEKTESQVDGQVVGEDDNPSDESNEDNPFKDIDVEEFFKESPEEAAEMAADVVCTYLDDCMRQTVSCSITSQDSGNPGSSPRETVQVNCEVSEMDMSFDDCLGQMTVTIQEGFECADINSQQASQIEACFTALRTSDCVEITDELLREYEAALARGEDSGIGNLPPECMEVASVFDCGEPSGETDVSDPASTNVLSCIPNQIAACTCNDGSKGTQTCMPDRTYSPCICQQAIVPVSAGMGGGGMAGVGGGVPARCLAGAINECLCPDGSTGTQECIDGRSYSDCECD